MARTRRLPTPEEAVEQGKQGRIDDTLATTAVFDMTPEELLGHAPDPRGVAIGQWAAEIVKRQLRETGELIEAAEQADAPASDEALDRLLEQGASPGPAR